MKFTLSWLNEYVSTDGLSPEQLAEQLTMLGLEVDSVERLHAAIAGILTAKIIEVRPHPKADRLRLCDIDIGGGEQTTVVCGAPNAAAGLVTAVALPGVSLPGGMQVKKAKIRGVESSGMLCSAKELGISDEHAGIMELDPTIEPGRKLVDVLHLLDDVVEIDLTPNRPDCASVLGIARETAGLTRSEFKRPVSEPPVLDDSDIDFSVTIEAPELCPRYAARRLTNVKIGPSPWWLQKRLLAVGMRPINNIVDVTNYVLLEYGQPLHAFDFQKLAGGAIVVRPPRENEKSFFTLDEVKRDLEPNMLMICDAEQPVAVAGVMGGLNSEVGDETTEILVESACFDPVSIRSTARKLNLSSESSYRFERGVDPNGVTFALERAVTLMAELSGGTILPGGRDLYPGKCEPVVLNLRQPRVCAMLGIDISSTEIADHLRSIEFEVSVNDSVLAVTVPSFRVDIEREVDLIEEVARLVGYNDIPTVLPRIGMDYSLQDDLRKFRKQTTAHLLAQGFNEAINYSFIADKSWDKCNLTPDDPRREVVRLLNPLTEEQAVMRTMLLPALLENIRHNLNHQRTDIRLFEIGKIFQQRTISEQPHERMQLCAVISGERYPDAEPFHFSGLPSDYFDIKGVAESLIQAFRIRGGSGKLQFGPAETKPEPYAEAQSFLVLRDGEEQIGAIGKLNRATAKNFGIKQDVYFLEMDLERLCFLPTEEIKFKSLPRFPSVKRDIALLVPESVAAGDLLAAIRDFDTPYVERADIFDVYQGKPIEQGVKSVAIAVTYRSAEQTLDDETVDKVHDKIVSSLMSDFGGRYREGQE